MTFKHLANYFQQLEQTSSRLKITDILAELFKEASEEEIAKIVYLSLGRLLPAYEGLEFQMADKMMIRAIAKAFGVETHAVEKEYKKVGDLGTVGQELKVKSTLQDSGDLGVTKVYNRLLEIAKESGAGSVERKIDKMAALLEDLDELSVRYVIRIPLGKLRMGFSEMTILDGLSWMLMGGKSLRSELEDAYNVVADVGEIAKIVKSSLTGQAKFKVQNLSRILPKIGTPVVVALCQRLGSFEEIIEKLGKVAVEPKYDGERLEIHLGEETAKIFSRSLENITSMFPDIVEALPKELKADEAILDGEGIGIDPETGKFIPFQDTMVRKRKHQIGEKVKEIPFVVMVFDILYKDGQSLIKTSFEKRRKILEESISSGSQILKLSPQIVTDEVGELKKYHQEQIAHGLEGVVVKKINSFYEPGRRGFKWVKLKQEQNKVGAGLADTIDGVVMGTSPGRGKRADFGVGTFLVGIRKNDRYVTVTKLGTGLSDEQFRQFKIQSSKFKVQKKPKEYEVHKNLIPDTWIEPKIVVEIQADNITQSPVHTAGLALRFPRLVRFRTDKSPEKITTLTELEHLYKLQFSS